MFNKHLNPKDLLKYVFSDLKEVLIKMRDAGLNMSHTPPHFASVYMLLDSTDSSSVGVGRSDPIILKPFSKVDWLPLAVFELEEQASSQQVPLGAFIGFIDKHRFTKNTAKKDLDIFVGILISEDGSESVGCYAPLENLSATFEIQPSVREHYPFFSTLYCTQDFEYNSH